MPAYTTVQTSIVIQKFKWVSFTILVYKTKMHDMHWENVQQENGSNKNLNFKVGEEGHIFISSTGKGGLLILGWILG